MGAHNNNAKVKAVESDLSLRERLRGEINRSLQRGVKGLALLGAPPPAVGLTPKTLLHRRGTLSLYHYHAQSDEIYRVPILLVMASTNRGYIFDLAPGQSLIEFLLLRGYDVYVMDWNPPSPQERHLTLEHYTQDFIPDCIARVQQDSGEEDISLVGYCMGGLMSAVYVAQNPDGPVKNLVCFTTPVDFHKMELWTSWFDERALDVDRLVDAAGILQPETVIRFFEMLRPASGAAGQVRLWDNLWHDEFVKSYRVMDRWAAETLPLPGDYVRQIVKELFRKNALLDGSLRIGGQPVDLRNIRVPLLHVLAANDHIVPPACGQPLVALASSTDKEEVVLPGGHVSLVAGANAVKRMWPKLDQWLQTRST